MIHIMNLSQQQSAARGAETATETRKPPQPTWARTEHLEAGVVAVGHKQAQARDQGEGEHPVELPLP